MKKVYMIPNTEVIKIETNHILAGSGEETMPVSETTVDDGLSRRRTFSIWEDEE